MLRLRVSDIDRWVAFVEPAQPEFEIPLEEFIAYMRRELPETDDMLAGRAFHAWLERAAEGDEMEEVQEDGFTFRFGGDFDLALPDVREQPVEKLYDTPSGPVLLRGRVDGWDSRGVIDYKLTLGQFDAERYAGSVQWKAYLHMTGAERFRYLVFQGKRTERDVFIWDLHDFALWAYPEIGREVGRRVAELAEFVHRHVPEMIEDDAPVLAGGVRRI